MLHLLAALKQRHPKSLVNPVFYKRKSKLPQEDLRECENPPPNSTWLILEGEGNKHYYDNINTKTHLHIQHNSSWRVKGDRQYCDIIIILSVTYTLYLYHILNIVDVYDGFEESCSDYQFSCHLNFRATGLR